MLVVEDQADMNNKLPKSKRFETCEQCLLHQGITKIGKLSTFFCYQAKTPDRLKIFNMILIMFLIISFIIFVLW